MHPNQSHRQYLAQQHGRKVVGGDRVRAENGLIRRWLGAAFRHWQRRKMIATLEAMDDRILRDIGLIRGDIPRVVQGLLDLEPESAPTASAARAERHTAPYRKAA